MHFGHRLTCLSRCRWSICVQPAIDRIQCWRPCLDTTSLGWPLCLIYPPFIITVCRKVQLLTQTCCSFWWWGPAVLGPDMLILDSIATVKDSCRWHIHKGTHMLVFCWQCSNINQMCSHNGLWRLVAFFCLRTIITLIRTLWHSKPTDCLMVCMLAYLMENCEMCLGNPNSSSSTEFQCLPCPVWRNFADK